MAPDIEVPFEFVKSLAATASAMILEASNKQNKSFKEKLTFADLVTETDVNIEKTLISTILAKYPHHLFLCEESSKTTDKLTDGPTWVIDPIDGTTNFIHGFPFCCVSIAFMRSKEVVYGCVYAPLLNEFFCAEKGGGAFLNEKKISVSQCKTLSKCLLATDLNVSKLDEVDNSPVEEGGIETVQQHIKRRNFTNLAVLCPRIRGIRCLASCAIELSYIACGRLDAYFEFGPHEWDIAAGMLLVREAGGKVLDVTGAELEDVGKGRLLAAATLELGTSISDLLIT